MGLGAILAGSSIAMDLFGGMQQRNAMEKERAATRPQRQMLKQIFNEESENVRDLPGVLKRAREGRLSTAQAERQKRLERAMAASGATGASSVGQFAETQNIQDMERMNEQALLSEKQAASDANARLFGMGSSLVGIQSQVPRSYYNPMSAVGAGLRGYALGSALEGPNYGRPSGAMDPRYDGSNLGMPSGSMDPRFASGSNFGIPEDLGVYGTDRLMSGSYRGDLSALGKSLLNNYTGR